MPRTAIYALILMALLWAALPWARADAAGGWALFGVRWRDAADLRQLEAMPGAALRHVAPGVALLAGDAVEMAAALDAAGRTPLFADPTPLGQDYFLCDHSHGEAPTAPVHLVYRGRGPGGWALVRVPVDRLAAAFEAEHFLYPLPPRYDLGRATPAARPTARAPSPEVAALLDAVDEDRMRRDVATLTLADPDRGSVPGNIRSRYARRPEALAAATWLRQELGRTLGASAVRLDTFHIAPGDSLMVNVVGELAGTDPAAGVWIVCAHYDAIGVRSRDGDLVRIGEDPGSGWDWRLHPAPGADDNATGVALVLESARLLATRRFPWSVRFICWSGEELGLWGSRHYANAARDRGDHILGVLNFDMIGFNDRTDRLELVANPSSAWLVDHLRQTNERYGLGLQVDVLQDRYAGLSDHAPFWAVGYDAILGIENYLPTDELTAGVVAGDYRINTQYHTVVDLPDSVNWGLVGRVTRLAVAAMAQFGAEVGLPDLAVFDGDLRGAGDHLLVRVTNLGPGRVDGAFGVRLSRCAADSTGCAPVAETSWPGPLDAGGAADLAVPWGRYGEAVFLVEVDPDGGVAEEGEGALNRSFHGVRLVAEDDVVVFPNPFHPDRDPYLRFSGVPRYARVQLYLGGSLVWRALEEAEGNLNHEVRWSGVNAAGFAVGSGVYYYDVRSLEGAPVARGKVAVVR